MPRQWKRVLALSAGALAGIGMVAVLAIWGLSTWRLRHYYPVSPELIAVPDDSASIARGRHLATAIGKCVLCHGDDLGGALMAMGPVGTFAASNLTSGAGGVGGMSDLEWIRAIRHGLRPNTRPLLFMPSSLYSAMSEPDLAALLAYLKSVPPVDNTLTPTAPGPIGRIILAVSPEGLLAAEVVSPTAPIPPAVPADTTVAYGGYLAVIGLCAGCHGPGLRGGLKLGPPATPATTDLTPAGPMADWSEADFRTALRAGTRPDGTAIDPFMPYRLTRLMTDPEITAVWKYLRSL